MKPGPLLINVTCVEQKGRTSHRQLVHVEQLVVLPQEGTEEVRPSSGKTYDLTFFVDTQGFTAEIARQHTQGLHATGLGPDEGFKNSCGARGRVGETHDRPVIVDRCGSVPGIASDVAKISRNTVFPKHRMFSANTSDRNTTIAGDADHLTEVINCCH